MIGVVQPFLERRTLETWLGKGLQCHSFGYSHSFGAAVRSSGLFTLMCMSWRGYKPFQIGLLQQTPCSSFFMGATTEEATGSKNLKKSSFFEPSWREARLLWLSRIRCMTEAFAGPTQTAVTSRTSLQRFCMGLVVSFNPRQPFRWTSSLSGLLLEELSRSMLSLLHTVSACRFFTRSLRVFAFECVHVRLQLDRKHAKLVTT